MPRTTLFTPSRVTTLAAHLPLVPTTTTSPAAPTSRLFDSVQNFTLGLGYDFKVVKVTGVYSWNKLDFAPLGDKDADLNN